jgi:hypothetical protein
MEGKVLAAFPDKRRAALFFALRKLPEEVRALVEQLGPNDETKRAWLRLLDEFGDTDWVVSEVLVSPGIQVADVRKLLDERERKRNE